MMRCLIVDDEPLARKLIRTYLAQIPQMEVVGEFRTPLDAMQVLQQGGIDVIFLDIEMPNLSGLDFLRSLKQRPWVVLITAYQQFALEAFELDVVDYLLKPVSFPRFLEAVNRVSARLTSAPLAPPLPADSGNTPEWTFVKSDYKQVKLLFSEVLYLEAMGEYVKIQLINGKHTVYQTLKEWEEKLPQEKFLRVHKSYIVRLGAIDSYFGNTLVVAGKEVPIGKTYKELVLNRLEGL